MKRAVKTVLPKVIRFVQVSFILFILLTSCNRYYDIPPPSYDIVFEITDENGEDLLDPASTNPKAIKTIRYYTQENGEWVQQRRYSNPNTFSVREYDGQLLYRFYTYGDHTSEKETSILLKWNDADADTIRCEWNKIRGEYVWQITKLYLNDQLWPLYTDPYDGRLVKLVK